eukprot:g1385.t1
MSGDDLDSSNSAGLNDESQFQLKHSHHRRGCKDSTSSLCDYTLNNEILHPAKKNGGRSSWDSLSVSGDDSAIEFFERKGKDEAAVDECKDYESCEMVGTKIDQGYLRKLKPTWDFMEGCSYDVQNYKINGELSYIKDSQPSKKSSHKFAISEENFSTFDISCSFGNEYFLPLSQSSGVLKCVGPRIVESGSDIKCHLDNDWDESQKLTMLYDHSQRFLVSDSDESKCYDSICSADHENLGSCGQNVLVDGVGKSLDEDDCEDPSLESSICDECSLDDLGDEYLGVSDDDMEVEDLREGGIAKAFRFVVGMGAFAALHLLK